jgi:thymidylate synthase (FAD)
MNVKLVSLTNPVVDEKIKTAEDLIVYCARVSNPSNQLNTETAPKLLKYCVDNNHWSIFEMATMCVEIKTSRAIAAQILRHRFSFQEFSQRYSTATELEPLEWRLQGKTNRQVGEEEYNISECSRIRIQNLQKKILKEYDDLLKQGVAKECARMILPLNTQTTLYMSGTVRSWIHYLNVRTDNHTQKEHRDIALKIKNIFKENFPNISKSLNF